MKRLLDAAGRAGLLVFGSAFIVYVPGILEAPNVDVSLSLAVAGAAAAIVAVLAALKEAFPKHFSWALVLSGRFSPAIISRLDIFTFAVVGSAIVSLTDLLNAAPDLELWPAALTAVVTGALAAGFRTIVGATTKGETPLSDSGLGPVPS